MSTDPTPAVPPRECGAYNPGALVAGTCLCRLPWGHEGPHDHRPPTPAVPPPSESDLKRDAEWNYAFAVTHSGNYMSEPLEAFIRRAVAAEAELARLRTQAVKDLDNWLESNRVMQCLRCNQAWMNPKVISSECCGSAMTPLVAKNILSSPPADSLARLRAPVAPAEALSDDPKGLRGEAAQYAWEDRVNALQGAAEALKRIEGCQHTLERMAYWSKEGACPICLTATCGMLRDEVARLKEEARAKDVELAGLNKEAEKGQKFKAFVHSYLTKHGVPEDDPTNEHSKQNCRIGARLDLMFTERNRLRETLKIAHSYMRLAEEATESDFTNFDAALDVVAAALAFTTESPQTKKLAELKDPQAVVAAVVQKQGGLWPRKEIILKLLEELGEAQKAFRKESRDRQEDEFGDVYFALMCLAVREDINSNVALQRAIVKHISTVKGTEPICPDCGREKANQIGDVLQGKCPKWYALRDPEAEKDCHRVRDERGVAPGG